MRWQVMPFEVTDVSWTGAPVVVGAEDEVDEAAAE